MNTFAVLPFIVSGLVYFLIGWIWYTPLFGKTWAQESGISMTGSRSAAATILPMVGQLVSSFLYALGVYLVLMLGNFYSLKGALIVAASVTAFFALSINSGKLLFNAKPKLYFIDVGYQAVGAVVVALILAFWK